MKDKDFQFLKSPVTFQQVVGLIKKFISLGNFIPLSQKGVANGVSPLNGASKIDAIYLPSYVDDVLEFANLASFPVTGETGIIYVALDTNRTYRWSGSVYIEISSDQLPVFTNLIYVAPNGTDTVGKGTATDPYATIEYALEQIIDASISNPYTISMAPGVYTEDLILKPNISINGNASKLIGAMLFDEEFMLVDSGTIFENFEFDGSFDFDFSSAVAGGISVNISFSDIDCINNGNFILNGAGKIDNAFTIATSIYFENCFRRNLAINNVVTSLIDVLNTQIFNTTIVDLDIQGTLNSTGSRIYNSTFFDLSIVCESDASHGGLFRNNLIINSPVFDGENITIDIDSYTTPATLLNDASIISPIILTKYSIEKSIDLVSNTAFLVALSTPTAGLLSKAVIDVVAIGTAGTFTISIDGDDVPELTAIPVANNEISLNFPFEINSRINITFADTIDVVGFTTNLQYTAR